MQDFSRKLSFVAIIPTTFFLHFSHRLRSSFEEIIGLEMLCHSPIAIAHVTQCTPTRQDRTSGWISFPQAIYQYHYSSSDFVINDCQTAHDGCSQYRHSSGSREMSHCSLLPFFGYDISHKVRSPRKPVRRPHRQ